MGVGGWEVEDPQNTAVQMLLLNTVQMKTTKVCMV